MIKNNRQMFNLLVHKRKYSANNLTVSHMVLKKRKSCLRKPNPAMLEFIIVEIYRPVFSK